LTPNKKLEIQNIAEKILAKYNIDPSSENYFLKLRKPHYDDLVFEKEGEDVLVGHYYFQSDDLIFDPVFAFDYNHGYWFPVKFEQFVGDTICSTVGEGGLCYKFPRSITEFRSFQKMFAENIKYQKWLEDGVRIP